MAIDYKVLLHGEKDRKQDKLNHQWWKATEEDLPNDIKKLVDYIVDNQTARLTQEVTSARLYGNLGVLGRLGVNFSKTGSAQNTVKDRISYNVCQSVVDTVTAKIAKNRPRPQFLTSGGDYKKQRRAKKLNQFVDGIFYENKAYEIGLDAFRDGAVFGDGWVHTFREHGRVKFERVLSSELVIDEIDGFYGKPRSMHRIKNVDRDVLIEMFPEHKDKLSIASTSNLDDEKSHATVSDTLVVIESWHLPSGPEASDGKHCLTVENCALLDEEWTRDHFPFARIPWSKRLFGPWSQGLIEQIQNIQLEINKLLWVIQRSMHLAGSFKVLMENGSKIVKEHVNNDIGAIISYTGVRPEYIVPPIVAPEVYQHLQTLKASAYEQAGISQLSAASKKPDGLDSGKALREYNDIESERFMVVGKAYEAFYLDLAALAIEEAKAIHEEEGTFSVKTPGAAFLNKIDWSDVAMDDDDYVMQMFPTSSLPKDPAGRLQTIQEYAQAGYISPRTAKKLLDFPDIEAEESLANAAEEYLHEVFDKMLEDGTYTPPEPDDDLMLARQLSLNYYAWAKTQGVEQEKLELIRRFRDQIDVLLGTASQASGPAAGGSAPLAAPEAPPTSDLLPNAPVAA